MIESNLLVSPDELRTVLVRQGSNKTVVIDVREPDEFAEWRIAKSVNFPLTDRNFLGNVEKYAGRRQIVAVCTRGNRSFYAMDLLRGAGMRAWSLEGGLVNWSKIHLSSRVQVPGLTGAEIIQVRRLLRGCTSYLVVANKECAVFDPSSDTEQYTSIAGRCGFRITHVIDTHQHADHVSGARLLADTTGAKLHFNGLEEYAFDDFEPVQEGDRILLDRGSITIDAIHTPGHTVGSTCFLIENRALISGDTLFLDGFGRPDLHRREDTRARDLYRSCSKIFLTLDPEVIVLPGHFGMTEDTWEGKSLSRTLAQIDTDLRLTSASESEFVQTLLANELPPPSNYRSIISVNRGESRLDPALVDLLEEGHNRCVLPIAPFR